MTAHEFDELIARLSCGASRRETVRGIVGGALASAGVAAVTATSEAKGKGKGKGKGKKKKKRVAGEHNAVGNHERIFCHCPDDDPENCSTRRVKTKKFKKLMRQDPNSHRGPCEEATTTTSTTSSTTSTTTSTTTPEP